MLSSYFEKCLEIQAKNIKKMTEENIIQESYVVKMNTLNHIWSRIKKESKMDFYANVILKGQGLKLIEKTDEKSIFSNKEKEVIFYKKENDFYIDVNTITKDSAVKTISFKITDYNMRKKNKCVKIYFLSAIFKNGDLLGEDLERLNKLNYAPCIYKMKGKRNFNFLYNHLQISGFNCQWCDITSKNFESVLEIKNGLRKILMSIERSNDKNKEISYDYDEGKIELISFVSAEGYKTNEKHKPCFYRLNENEKLIDASYSYQDDKNRNVIPDFIEKYNVPVKKNYDWPKEYIELAEINNLFRED